MQGERIRSIQIFQLYLKFTHFHVRFRSSFKCENSGRSPGDRRQCHNLHRKKSSHLGWNSWKRKLDFWLEKIECTRFMNAQRYRARSKLCFEKILDIRIYITIEEDASGEVRAKTMPRKSSINYTKKLGRQCHYMEVQFGLLFRNHCNKNTRKLWTIT